jgi:hypothetical protein
MELLENKSDTFSTNSGSRGISESSDFFVANSDCSFGWNIKAPEKSEHR